MRKQTCAGALLVGMIVLGGWVAMTLPSAHGQYPDQAALAAGVARGELIALSAVLEDGRQQVTVIEPHAQVMSVYHVDPNTGAIALKSVRNIAADLQMDDFNGGSPSPQEIRALLNRN